MRVAFVYSRRAWWGSPGYRDYHLPHPIAKQLVKRLAKRHKVVATIDVQQGIDTLLSGVRESAPDVVFNLAEGLNGNARKSLVPALLDHLGLAYTFSGPQAMTVAADKWLAKQLAGANGVLVPHGRFVRDVSEVEPLEYDALVKPVSLSNSVGISERAVVKAGTNPKHVVAESLQLCPDGVVLDQIIPGLDATVPWIEGIGATEPILYTVKRTHRGPHNLMTYDVKMAGALKHEVPGFDDDLRDYMKFATERTCTSLGLRGVGRVDFRVTDDEAYMIDVNVLPALGPGAAFYKSVKHTTKMTMDAVLAHFVSTARRR